MKRINLRKIDQLLMLLYLIAFILNFCKIIEVPLSVLLILLTANMIVVIIRWYLEKHKKIIYKQ